MCEISIKEGFFECFLKPCTLQFGPMKQTMCIERVVNAVASTTGLIRARKFKTHFSAARSNIFSIGIGLLWRNAVFLGDVLSDFLTFRRHGWV